MLASSAAEPGKADQDRARTIKPRGAPQRI
jgi:hypothetical protein